ncbi:MAG: hypothetical protein U1E89_09405 [Burkholderiaceae bacterium]
MNSLIASLPWPRPARMSARLQPLAVTLAELALVQAEPPAAAAEAERDDEVRSGWLDSSLDLARGLEVIEFTDRLPDDLQIDGLLWPERGA